MNVIAQRLEFNNVFPNEKAENLEFYLDQVSKKSLLHLVGFTNLTSDLNYYQFFSNRELQEEINSNIETYIRETNSKAKLSLMSREASLRISEIILSRQSELSKGFKDADNEELNLFKAFLIINKEINDRFQSSKDGVEGVEKVVDMMISLTFPISDLRLSESDNEELLKLMYCTIYKIEALFAFLESKTELKYLLDAIVIYFNQESSDSLMENIKKLFGTLIAMRQDKAFILNLPNGDLKNLVNSLISDAVIKDDDFSFIKNSPIYQLDNGDYGIIDDFFVINKFFKSIKFELKRVFDDENKLNPKDRKFFQFFNNNFSEDFLAKNLLDSIFYKKYFIKMKKSDMKLGKPDYYVRNGKDVYLFEIKDVMISKSVKSSGDITKINEILIKKFLFDKKDVGIGQLCCRIEEVVNKEFLFEDIANEKSNFKIYPILLIIDNILEVPGVNYKLNQWYHTLLKKKIGDKYNPHFIKDLVLIDINTLIYWESYLREKDRNLKDLLDAHLKLMRTKYIATQPDFEIEWIKYQKKLLERFNPISFRNRRVLMDKDLILKTILPQESNLN